MDNTILDLAQLFSNAEKRALPAGNWNAAPSAGEALIAHEDYMVHREPPFRYKFEDIASFTAYCAANVESGEGEGIILYTNRVITALHHWLQPAGNKVCYNFELSPELLAWEMVKSFSHRKFKNFLEERLDELVDTELFAALTTLKLNTSITFQSDLEDDRNYGFIYEEKSAKGTSKIPKYIGVCVPFFVNDPAQEVPMKVDVTQPKSSDDKPRFSIEIIRRPRLLSDNVTRLIEELKVNLPDHMILHGSSTV